MTEQSGTSRRDHTLPGSPRDIDSEFFDGPGSHPDIPEDICDPLWYPGCEELEELWYFVLKELTDPRFANRKHGNRRTQEAGCSGPMCRKAIRDHTRRRSGNQPSERYRYVDAVIEYMAEDARVQIWVWQRHMLRSLSRLF